MLFHNERPFMNYILDEISEQSIFIAKFKDTKKNGFRNLIPLVVRNSSSALYKFDSESTASSKVAEILFGLGNEPNVYIVQNLFARSDQPNSSFLPNINNFSLSTDHSSKSNKKMDTPSKKNEKKSKEPCGTPPNCCLESETVRDQIRNLNSQSHSSPQALQNRNSPQVGTVIDDIVTGISTTAAYLFGRNAATGQAPQSQTDEDNENAVQDSVLVQQLRCIPWDEDLANNDSQSIPMLFKHGKKLPEPPEHLKMPTSSGHASPTMLKQPPSKPLSKTDIPSDERACQMSSPVDPSCYFEFASLDTSLYDENEIPTLAFPCDKQAACLKSSPPSAESSASEHPASAFRPIFKDQTLQGSKDIKDNSNHRFLPERCIKNTELENNDVSNDDSNSKTSPNCFSKNFRKGQENFTMPVDNIVPKDVPHLNTSPNHLIKNSKKDVENCKMPVQGMQNVNGKLPIFARPRAVSLPQNYLSKSKRVYLDRNDHGSESNISSTAKTEKEVNCLLSKLQHGQKRYSDPVKLNENLLSDKEKKALEEIGRRFKSSTYVGSMKRETPEDNRLGRDPQKETNFTIDRKVSPSSRTRIDKSPNTERVKTSPDRSVIGFDSFETFPWNEPSKFVYNSYPLPPPPPNSPNLAYSDVSTSAEALENAMSRTPYRDAMKGLVGSTMELFQTSDFEAKIARTSPVAMTTNNDNERSKTPPLSPNQSSASKRLPGNDQSSDDRFNQDAQGPDSQSRDDSVTPEAKAASPAPCLLCDKKFTEKNAGHCRNFQSLRDEIVQAIQKDSKVALPDDRNDIFSGLSSRSQPEPTIETKDPCDSDGLKSPDSARDSGRLSKFQKLFTGIPNSFFDDRDHCEKRVVNETGSLSPRDSVPEDPQTQPVPDTGEPETPALKQENEKPCPVNLRDNVNLTISFEPTKKGTFMGTPAKYGRGTDSPPLLPNRAQRETESKFTFPEFNAAEALRNEENRFQAPGAKFQVDFKQESLKKPEEKTQPLFTGTQQPTSFLGEPQSLLSERMPAELRRHSFQGPLTTKLDSDKRPNESMLPLKSMENQPTSFAGKSALKTRTSPDPRQFTQNGEKHRTADEVIQNFSVYKQRRESLSDKIANYQKPRPSEVSFDEQQIQPHVTWPASLTPNENLDKSSNVSELPSSTSKFDEKHPIAAGARGRRSKLKQPEAVSELDEVYFHKKLAGHAYQPRNSRLTIDPRAMNRLSSRMQRHIHRNEYQPHPAGIILTRPEYYTIPTMEELANMTDDNGVCIVSDFTVGRIGYGTVRFEGKIDVTGLNLDEIVQIRRKEIAVYPDDSSKPPLGVGLNRRAEVALDNSWPIDIVSREPITDPKEILTIGWVEDLELITEKMGAHFLEFRQETGSWVFLVEHFSEYSLVGLCDSQLKFIRRSNSATQEKAEMSKWKGKRLFKYLKKIIG